MTRPRGSIAKKERVTSGEHKGEYKFIGQFEAPPNPITGKRNRITRTVYGATRGDALDKLDALRREYEDGMPVNADKTTFAEYSRTWLEAQEEKGLAARTMDDNRCIVRVLCAAGLGGMRLRDVTAPVIRRLYRQLKEERGLGGNRLRKYHVKLKQILQQACDDDILRKNYAALVDAPKKEAPSNRALSRDEAARLIRCLDAAEAAEVEALRDREAREGGWSDDGISHHTGRPRTAIRGIHGLSNAMAVRLALLGGLRVGEIMGLVWGRVDLANGRLRVCKSLTIHGEVKEPKTEAGKRTVSIDGGTVAHLVNLRAEQTRNLKRLGIDLTDETPVICSDTGGHTDIANFERWWREWRKENGFDGLKLHTCRHTLCTLMVGAGVDLKTIQAHFGWTSASIILDIYAHAVPENDEAAANLVGRLLADGPEPARQGAFKVVRTA